MDLKDALEARLTPHGQGHLLRFWNDLADDQQKQLAAEIEQIDFALIQRLYQEPTSGQDWAALARRAEQPAAFRLGSASNPYAPEQGRARGETALAGGEVGVILVAGGQGTRLGFDHPKGMYPIGPISGASLFQILLEKVLAVGRRWGVSVPLYVMTSPATHRETVDFLAEHQRFGMPAEDVTIFCQGTMPAVDARSGQLLLAERGRLHLSPDGHGGMLAALRKGSVLADIQTRGLRQMFYLQVDSPLVSMCDPEFIGYHLLCGSELSTQVVAKQHPLDKVGNLATVDGRLRIIEYSDLPEEAAQRRAADGSLFFWAGNTAVHVFDVAFLARMTESAAALPYHRACKKAAYIDERGQLITPAEPNAIKFEQFIFDLLPAAENAIVVETDAAKTFAPVKNGPGAAKDSPETVKAQITALHTQWLREAGTIVTEGTAVEISPLFALDAEQVAEKIRPGQRIDAPRYFTAIR